MPPERKDIELILAEYRDAFSGFADQFCGYFGIAEDAEEYAEDHIVEVATNYLLKGNFLENLKEFSNMQVVDGMSVFHNDWDGNCGPNEEARAYKKCCHDLSFLTQQP